ncbi:MAG: hypothetical protein IJ772_04970 [Bacilli bacterium]|nr:hypothetical protein [Bacilli bacterium]
MMNWFKKLFKKKKEPKEELFVREKNLFDTNIYCELLWGESERDKVFLYGINKIKDIKLFCGDVYSQQIFHTTQPRSNVYVPRILYEIDWGFILKENDINLKNFKITFTNYSQSVRNYTVILYAVNQKGKEINDTFTSTKKVFIDPWELTENIYKFLKFAEDYE